MKSAKYWLNLMGVWCVLFFGCVGVAWAKEGEPNGHKKGKLPPAISPVALPQAPGTEPADLASGLDARLKGVEIQLGRVEERIEGYRRHQDSALAEMDATWTNRLHALEDNIDACRESSAQKEVETIRAQSQTILQKALKEAQSEHDKNSSELRKRVESGRKGAIFWGLSVFGAIAALALLVLCGVALFSKQVGNNLLYCIEVVLLVAVLALISFGAFHLLSRIVDLGASGCAMQAITSPERNEAVLQAYEQLSNELERWVALLGILGTFFGLVLPVGAYLLQLKAVNREEEKIEDFVQKTQNAFEKQMSETMASNKRVMDATLESRDQKIWKAYADMQYDENLKCFQNLRKQAAILPNAEQKRWLWVQWISSVIAVVQALLRVRDDTFAKQKLKALIQELQGVQLLHDFAAMQEYFRNQYQNGTCQLEGGVDVLRRHCPDEMKELEGLLNFFGIRF